MAARPWHPSVRDIDPSAPFTFPEPSELPDCFDMVDYKHFRQRALLLWRRLQMPMLHAVDEDGKPLYRLNEGGSWLRTKPLSRSTRRKVIERDGCCVWCGAAGPFEVDHIKRYIDGGSNDLSNLRTLCEPCHRSRGGRA